MAKPIAGASDSASAPAKQGIHYAWYVLSSAVAMSTIGSGFGFYSNSAFYQPWETEFGWTRGQISLAMSLSGFLSGFLSPLFGRWTDRHGSRKVAAIGATVMGASYIAMAGTGTFPPFIGDFALPYLYATFMVMSLGRSGTSNIPISTAVISWFVKRRGLAMGIQSTGIGLGGVIIAPLMAFMIATFGWRQAFVAGGLMTWAIVFPTIAFVLRNRPSDMGLQPYGHEGAAHGTGGGAKMEVAQASSRIIDHPWTLKEAMRTPAFWCISFGMGLFFFGNSSILQHSIPFFSEKGESTVVAAAFLSAIAGLGIVGKLVSGYVVDRMSSARLVYVGSMVFQGAGFLILLYANSMPLYWLGIVVVGLSMGGVVALQPVMLGECFGIASFGAILGATSVIITVLNNVGSLYAGFMHDLTGDYQIAFFTMAALEIVAGVIASFAKPARPTSQVNRPL